jgi:hypothetical protein
MSPPRHPEGLAKDVGGWNVEKVPIDMTQYAEYGYIIDNYLARQERHTS